MKALLTRQGNAVPGQAAPHHIRQPARLYPVLDVPPLQGYVSLCKPGGLACAVQSLEKLTGYQVQLWWKVVSSIQPSISLFRVGHVVGPVLANLGKSDY